MNTIITETMEKIEEAIYALKELREELEENVESGKSQEQAKILYDDEWTLEAVNKDLAKLLKKES